MSRSSYHRTLRTLAAYDASVDAYAGANADRSVIEPMLQALTERLSTGDRVVDLGCGPGWETRELTRRGFPTVGLDISAELLRLAGREQPGRGYVRGDLRRLPLRDGVFAGAWACASLLHLSPDEAGHALAEVRRILAPGGVFVSSVQMGETAGFVSGPAVGPRYYAFHQPDEWRGRIEAAGLVVEDLIVVESDPAHLNEGATGWISAIARAPLGREPS